MPLKTRDQCVSHSRRTNGEPAIHFSLPCFLKVFSKQNTKTQLRNSATKKVSETKVMISKNT